MRVNIYAEEMTQRIEIVRKGIFTGVRFYLELPVTQGTKQIKGPFLHHEGDDDSSAVTFWGKAQLRLALKQALDMLDQHFKEKEQKP